jgi:hypothetical protein
MASRVNHARRTVVGYFESLPQWPLVLQIGYGKSATWLRSGKNTNGGWKERRKLEF